MSWGELYKKLESEWHARSLDERLRSRGWSLHPSSDGPDYWARPAPGGEGFISAQSMIGEDNDAGAVDRFLENDLTAGGWNPRDFFEKYRVLPLDDPYSGNGTYDDARLLPFGSGNLAQFLSYLSGDRDWRAGKAGEIVNDPEIGRVWVPIARFRGSFDPYRVT